MQIISYNVNGIRSAIKKGLVDWMKQQAADIVCFQETKSQREDVDVSAFEAMGYQSYWFSAEKKGYSGVAVFTKKPPNAVIYGQGNELSDREGRVLRLDFDTFSLVNAYFPSGTSGEERQAFKYQWLAIFLTYIEDLRKSQPNLVVVGDYNIAHTAIDIHDPKGNKKSSGFLPEERAWMDQWLSLGFTDVFRHLHPTATGAYSWWSQRSPTIREQNKGWRIDYICVSEQLTAIANEATILADVKHSDHCPVMVNLVV